MAKKTKVKKKKTKHKKRKKTKRKKRKKFLCEGCREARLLGSVI